MTSPLSGGQLSSIRKPVLRFGFARLHWWARKAQPIVFRLIPGNMRYQKVFLIRLAEQRREHISRLDRLGGQTGAGVGMLSAKASEGGRAADD